MSDLTSLLRVMLETNEPRKLTSQVVPAIELNRGYIGNGYKMLSFLTVIKILIRTSSNAHRENPSRGPPPHSRSDPGM